MTHEPTHTFLSLDPDALKSRVDVLLAAIVAAQKEVPVTNTALEMLELFDLERLAFAEGEYSDSALKPLRDYLLGIPGFHDYQVNGEMEFPETVRLHHSAVSFEILTLGLSVVTPAGAEVVVVNSILPRDGQA
jgi:hypothetical protein